MCFFVRFLGLSKSEVGKDLRASHIDIANGAEKSCGHWRAVQTSEMAQNAREKFSCRKPEGYYHLIAELRKSSVPLGANLVDPQFQQPQS